MTKRSSRRTETDPDVEVGDSMSLTPPRRTSPQDEVSPAHTFDTALTSPSTFEDTPRSNPAQKVTIEHNVKSASSARSAGLILGMSKPALAIAGMLVLGAGGAAAFGWFQIPGLNSQIKELEAQVAELSNEIDRLAVENDRFETLNDELNRTVEEFQSINEDLNATVNELEDITIELNSTNLELSERVDELAAENADYEQLNSQLNTTVGILSEEVEFFEVAIGQLVLENESLSNLTDSLNDVSTQLGNLTNSQNETLTALFTILNDIATENDRLEKLSSDLVSVVAFFNETTLGLGGTLEETAAFLQSQISANQVLLTQDLETFYSGKIDNWDCRYQTEFFEEPFALDENLAISDLPRVLTYVDQRILSEVCLDVDDFEAYLFDLFPDRVSTNRLQRAVDNYTALAFDFYFPDTGEEGVSPSEWSAASFECKNLQRQFSWR